MLRKEVMQNSYDFFFFPAQPPSFAINSED